MSTLHKVKAYFGMAPMDDYEDEYYEDDDRDAGRGRGFTRRPERFAEDVYEDMRPDVRAGGRYDDRDHYDERDADYPPTGGFRVGYAEEPRFRPREFERPHDMAPRSRFGTMRGSTRGALAMDPRRMAMLFEEGSPLSKITTLRPKDYNEARTIGERFRDGQPVIMDLVSMPSGWSTSPPVWRSRCGVPSTRLRPRSSCWHRPTSTSPPRSAAGSPRRVSTATSDRLTSAGAPSAIGRLTARRWVSRRFR
jgi:cell division inhibitor SepF